MKNQVNPDSKKAQKFDPLVFIMHTTFLMDNM